MNSRRYFGAVASRWNKMREAFFSDTLRNKAISIAGVEPGRVAADIGAGTGFITEGLIKRGVKVVAVDGSEAMVKEMKKRFNGKGVIDYRIGEAESLPIEDKSVDYAFANMFLHHVESPQSAIKEMVRILKPGGVLVITDLDKHGFEFLKVEHHDRWLGFKREDVRHWLIEAGLKGVKVDCANENCCAQSNCGGGYANINIFLAVGEK